MPPEVLPLQRPQPYPAGGSEAAIFWRPRAFESTSLEHESLHTPDPHLGNISVCKQRLNVRALHGGIRVQVLSRLVSSMPRMPMLFGGFGNIEEAWDATWAVLEPSSNRLRGVLEPSWTHLGPVLGSPGSPLGSS